MCALWPEHPRDRAAVLVTADALSKTPVPVVAVRCVSTETFASLKGHELPVSSTRNLLEDHRSRLLLVEGQASVPAKVKILRRVGDPHRGAAQSCAEQPRRGERRRSTAVPAEGRRVRRPADSALSTACLDAGSPRPRG